MDIGLLIALSTVTTDADRAHLRMKNCMKVMKANEIDAAEAFPDSTMSADDVVKSFEALGLPLVHPELQLVVAKYASRGKVNVDKMLRDLAPKVVAEKAVKKGETYDFGKGLFKKLCKLRSNEPQCDEFRKAVMSKDGEMVGHISRRDFQRALDHCVELTEEEAGLLAENCGFVDGRHAHDIDYPSVLLLLYEPMEKNCFTVLILTSNYCTL